MVLTASNFQGLDNEELIHICHGDSVSHHGGDLASRHLEAPPEAMAQLGGGAPTNSLLRPKGQFRVYGMMYIELRPGTCSKTYRLTWIRGLTRSGGALSFISDPSGQNL